MCKNGWSDLTVYASYDVLLFALCKKLPFGDRDDHTRVKSFSGAIFNTVNSLTPSLTLKFDSPVQSTSICY